MDDLISRSAVLEDINSLCCDRNKNWIGNENQSFVDHGDVVDIICDAPTIDAVPVVRCRDCKNRFTIHCPMHHEEQTYNEDDGYDWIERDHTSDDGFCDEGELATDDNL